MKIGNRMMLIGKKGALSFGPDLLSGLTWTPDGNTTYSSANGFARALAAVGGQNPRITKGPLTITAGKTYKLGGSVYKRTNIANFLRVHDVITMAAGKWYDSGSLTATTDLTGITFVAATSGTGYLGYIATISVQGDYGEVDLGFTLQESL